MRPLEEVLRQKEFEAEKLREEIGALRVAARILETDGAGANAAPRANGDGKSWP